MMEQPVKKHNAGEINPNEGGFTLIEIAIVVVIIGLLLGGILKGQEMIRNARSHNLADQGNAVKAAVLGFQDRYAAYPGDYANAEDNIPNVGTGNDGNGNSRIGNDPDDTEDGADTDRQNEIVYAWEHLARSGFISGNFASTTPGDVDEATGVCAAGDCMTNAFNGQMMLFYGNAHVYPVAADYNDGPKSTQITTGGQIPVDILAALDRKVDDGDPSSGSFRLSHIYIGAATGGTTECANAVDSATVVNNYNIASEQADCGGVYLF